jgi:Transcription factor TFIID (or TATA-binding protein, TBP)
MNDNYDFIESPIRISTMVVTADWGSPINLTALFEKSKAHIIPIGWPEEGILKHEHMNMVVGAAEKDIFTNRKVTSKSFFNQSTIVLRRFVSDERGFKEVNVKLFANGGIQMTGVINDEFSRTALDWLLTYIQRLDRNVFEFPDRAGICKFSMQLINTDYSLRSDINQEMIHRLLVDKYGLFSMLEKTMYQGVNTKYFINTQSKREGICNCTKICKGKGCGSGDGECKKITISIFRTGKIIITGARRMEEIIQSYNFLNRIIDTNRQVLVSRTA